MAHRYWAATLLTLLSLAGALLAGYWHLDARQTASHYSAAFAELLRSTQELEIAFLMLALDRTAGVRYGAPGQARAHLTEAVNDLGEIVWAIRASDRDGVENEETSDEAHLDELGNAARGDFDIDERAFGLEPGMMPEYLAEIWEADAEGHEAGLRLEENIGTMLALGVEMLDGAPEDTDLDGLLDRFRRLHDAQVEPGLAALRTALARQESIETRRLGQMIMAAAALLALIALANVFLIFRPMERAVLADRAALLAERDRAVRSEQAKRDFLAVMSHELRTPMNGVLGFANLLLDGRLDDEQRDHVETIVHSGEHLLEILNSILDISKIESGSYEIEPAPFELARIVDNVIKLLGPRAAEKHLELSAYIDPDLPRHVVGDAGAIRKILLNLVGNAIKFTPSGAVAMEVHRADGAGEDGTGEDGTVGLHVKVIDTGVGIPSDKVNQIFERFSQLDASSSRAHEGTGLGLAICRELAQMMDGGIDVDSTPDRGSCFHVRLRLAQTEPPAEPIARSIGTTLQGRRVLVVDDNDLNRRIARLQLESTGAHVTLAGGAHAAVREVSEAEARGRPFDLFVIDHMMPEIDGVHLLRELRKTPGGARVPAIISSSGGVTTDSAAATLGFDAAVAKPVPQARLLEIACRLTGEPSGVAGAEDSAIGAEDGAAAPAGGAPRPVAGDRQRPDAVTGRGGPAILVADDDMTNQRLARLALESAGFSVDCVGTGLEVLRAVERRSYDLVLMDIRMPEMDGFEAMRRLRDVPGRAQTMPVVAVSANAMTDDRKRYAETGFASFLGKPFAPDALVATVRAHLGTTADTA